MLRGHRRVDPRHRDANPGAPRALRHVGEERVLVPRSRTHGETKRNDGRSRVRVRGEPGDASREHGVAKRGGGGLRARHQSGLGGDATHGVRGGGGEVRGKRRGEDVARTHQALVRHHAGVSRAEPADGGAGVFERRRDDVDSTRLQTEMFGDASARGSHGAEGDGLVQYHARVVRLLEVEELREGRDAPGAREAPLGDEPSSSAGSRQPGGGDAILRLEVGEDARGVVRVAVVVPAHVHLRQAKPREDAVPDAAIDDGDVRFVTERGNHRGHRTRAEGIQHSLLGAEKLGDGAFRVRVRRERAVKPARRARSEAELFHRRRARLLHGGVVAERQHILRRERHVVRPGLFGDAGEGVRIDGALGRGHAEMVAERRAARV